MYFERTKFSSFSLGTTSKVGFFVWPISVIDLFFKFEKNWFEVNPYHISHSTWWSHCASFCMHVLADGTATENPSRRWSKQGTIRRCPRSCHIDVGRHSEPRCSPVRPQISRIAPRDHTANPHMDYASLEWKDDSSSSECWVLLRFKYWRLWLVKWRALEGVRVYDVRVCVRMYVYVCVRVRERMHVYVCLLLRSEVYIFVSSPATFGLLCVSAEVLCFF